MENINSKLFSSSQIRLYLLKHSEEMIYAFIKWSSNEICDELIKIIKEFVPEENLSHYKKDSSYILFSILGRKSEYSTCKIFLENFFYCIVEATIYYDAYRVYDIAYDNTNEIRYTKEYIQNIIEPLVAVACECKKILYWHNFQEQTILRYYNFDKLLNAQISKHINGFNRKSLKICSEIINNKSKLFLIKDNNEIEIEGVNTISQNPKKNRFITMYKAFSDAIDKNIYCPWCNPDETLEYHCRCNECEELIKFFVPETDDNIKEYKKERNKFNTYLKRQEVKNDLTATIKKRGIYLLDKLEKLKESSKKNNNNEEMLQFYERVKKIIEKRFKV